MVVTKVDKHVVSSANAYFFDTNVWIYIFAPIAGTDKRKQSVYSSLLKDIQSRNATIFVSSLVLSEYINAMLRMGFKQWKRVTGNVNADFKKDYRNTEDYQTTLEDAVLQVKEILKVCTKRPDDFHIIDIDSVLVSMNQDADYNDVYYIKDCENQKMKFVSDDTDIQKVNSSIMLITA
jgi:predicted nucleic acid-binding protein